MICTKCHTDDGFEAPSVIGFTTDCIKAICAGWLCPPCLDQHEAEGRQQRREASTIDGSEKS